ncbi:efflux RND transporter permease subunit [Ochrobactrum pseudogrignonense]|nr:efflux RND transporter permease subunit [Brucella pseudogrignonensis]
MRKETACEKGFNLSDWALNHRSLVWYFMLVFLVAGLISYLDLGRAEDPEFTVKTMVVQANWPGASIDETMNRSQTASRRSSKSLIRSTIRAV